MRRFGRRRGRPASSSNERSIDAAAELARIREAGIVTAGSLEPVPADGPDGVPAHFAAVGIGEDEDGRPLLVAFSPTSGGDAALAAASAALGREEPFAGTAWAVSPVWTSACLRRLGLLGELAFPLRPVAAPGLASGEGAPAPELPEAAAVVPVRQVAGHLESAPERELFERAARALSGLAAKHGGAVRGVGRSVELVIHARRVAELQAGDRDVQLVTLQPSRSSAELEPGNLAESLDRLEGALRKRLNDRRLRDGDEGLRGPVVALLARATTLRCVTPWPLGGQDLDALDAVAIDAEGRPVAAAVREQLALPDLAAILDALQRLRPALPVVLEDAVPPVRLDTLRLALAASEVAASVTRLLPALTLAHDVFEVRRGAGGPEVVALAAGEAAPPIRSRGRPSRRGREDERAREEEPVEGADAAAGAGKEAGAAKTAGAGRQAADDEEGGGRSRGRSRRRRGRRRSGRGGDAREDAGDGSAGSAGSDGGDGGDAVETLSAFDLEDGDASGEAAEGSGRSRRRRGRRRGRRGGGDERDSGRDPERDAKPRAGSSAPSTATATADAADDDVDEVDDDELEDDLSELDDDPIEASIPEPAYDDEDESDEGDDEETKRRLERERRRLARAKAAEPVAEEPPPKPRRRAAIVAHADRDSLLAAVLLARDVRLVEGIWVYPQAELMTFFRSVATDLRDETPIHLVGFTASPARDVLQAASLYGDRVSWFDHHEWPPEDLDALKRVVGDDQVHVATGCGSALPPVLATATRRSRFSDKLVDLATGRFTTHDYERWGRLWWHRLGEIAGRPGDCRAAVEPLLAGRPSDLAREAARVEQPPPPDELAYVSGRDFRLVHFSGYLLVVVPVVGDLDPHLTARVARERYGASLSLARREGEELLLFAGDELPGRRSLDFGALVEHLADKLDWVESYSDEDHVARFRVRSLAEHPERLDEVVGEIAMGRSILER